MTEEETVKTTSINLPESVYKWLKANVPPGKTSSYIVELITNEMDRQTNREAKTSEPSESEIENLTKWIRFQEGLLKALEEGFWDEHRQSRVGDRNSLAYKEKVEYTKRNLEECGTKLESLKPVRAEAG